MVLPYTTRASNSFPAWQDTLVFHADLRSAALITNLPNPSGEDYFIGFSTAIAGFHSESGETQMIPAARVSIYPTPGYNLWAQFAKWPGELPAFSVGTGVQVEFPGDNIRLRKAIGLTWNELHTEQFIQRDITAHALYGRTQDSFYYGLIGSFNSQHVLVKNGNEIPDFDESFMQVIPYIGWMFNETIRISFKVPMDVENTAVDMSCEWFWGMRD